MGLNADRGFKRGLDFDTHQRIQSKIREWLIVTETVRLDSQNGTNGFPHGLTDNSLLFSR